MSVAFRRESDEEHLEPRFELPIPPGPNLVTPRGLALIEAEVAAREAALRDITDAEARKPVERELRYWQTRRATAELDQTNEFLAVLLDRLEEDFPDTLRADSAI